MIPDLPRITVDQLQVGMYVDLELGWLKHPFPFSRFKISSTEQILSLIHI